MHTAHALQRDTGNSDAWKLSSGIRLGIHFNLRHQDIVDLSCKGLLQIVDTSAHTLLLLLMSLCCLL
jgi:hypothetical protein